MANRNASRRSYDYNPDNNRDYDYYEYDNDRGYYDPYYYNRGYYGGPGYGYYYGNYDFYNDYGYSYPYRGYSNYSDLNNNRGQYSGYGPRGYTRSDDRIKDDVNDRLTWHGQLDATDINVDVNDGVVTLTGSVDSRRDKRLAEDIADNVSGVWDVNNQLTVRNRSGQHGSQGNSASGSRGQIREGMDVYGRDGSRIGSVKEVRSNDFLVDRTAAFDVYIPFSACSVDNGRINVNVPAGEVDNQGWDMPEKMGTHKHH